MFKLNPTENTCNSPKQLSFQLNDTNVNCGTPGKLNFSINESNIPGGEGGGIVLVFDTDNNLLATITAPGQYVVTDSLVTVKRSDNSIIVTQQVLAQQPFDFTVNDTEITLRDENNNILRTLYLKADTIIDETIFNTTVQLQDTANNNIGLPYSFLAESSNIITAPDAIAVIKDTLGNILKTENILSNDTEDIIINDTIVQLQDTLGNNIGSPDNYPAESSNIKIAPDGVVDLLDTASNLISTTNVPSNSSINITAPDATVTLNSNSFISPRSGQTVDVPVIDKNNNTYVPYITGNTLRIAKERRHDWQSPYSYCGYAQYLSSEGANVWRVTRITLNNDGTTVVGVANNVNWTNRYTHIYL